MGEQRIVLSEEQQKKLFTAEMERITSEIGENRNHTDFIEKQIAYNNWNKSHVTKMGHLFVLEATALWLIAFALILQ